MALTKEQRYNYYHNVVKPRNAQRKLAEKAMYLKMLDAGIKLSEEQMKVCNEEYDIKDT